MNIVQSHAAEKTVPKVVVFDFGNVVGETNQEKLVGIVQRELQVPQEEAKALVYGFKQREEAKEGFWEEYAMNKGKDLPGGWPERYAKLKRSVIESNPEVIKIVEELRANGFQTAMLSNTTPERALHIRSLGFYDYFEPVILSCDAGVAKPQKEAFEILLQRAHVSADQCVFVDNKKENVEVAARLGFDVILFTSAEALRSELEKRSMLHSEGTASQS